MANETEEKRRFATLSASVSADIEAAAEKEHRSFANMVEVLCMEALNRRESVRHAKEASVPSAPPQAAYEQLDSMETDQ